MSLRGLNSRVEKLLADARGPDPCRFGRFGLWSQMRHCEPHAPPGPACGACGDPMCGWIAHEIVVVDRDPATGEVRELDADQVAELMARWT